MVLIDLTLVIKVILLVIGSVTAVFGAGYIILAQFNPPNVNKKDMTLLSSMLLFVALASFIISFTIL